MIGAQKQAFRLVVVCQELHRILIGGNTWRETPTGVEDSTRHNSQPRNKEMVKFMLIFVLTRWRERLEGQRRRKHREPREMSTSLSSSIH